MSRAPRVVLKGNYYFDPLCELVPEPTPQENANAMDYKQKVY